MKKLIAVSLLAATVPAVAGVHATAKAEGGGEYVLLSERCSGGGQKAYVYLDDGRTEDGCWVADDRTVTVTWEETGKRRYPRAKFKLEKTTTKRVVTVTEKREW